MALSKPSLASYRVEVPQWPSDRGRSKSGRRGADPLDTRHAGARAAFSGLRVRSRGTPSPSKASSPRSIGRESSCNTWHRVGTPGTPKGVRYLLGNTSTAKRASPSDIRASPHPNRAPVPASPGRRASSGSRKSWLRSVPPAAPSPDWRARRARIASSGCRRVDRVTAGRRDGTAFAARPRRDRSVTEAKGPKPTKPEPNRDFERTPPSAVRAIFG
jgi:hypothetical protein